MLNKIDITRRLMEQLDDPNCPDFDVALKHWWIDWHEDKGLRLTQQGFDVFQSLKYEHYVCEITTAEPAKPSHLLIMDRHLTCPYYLKYGKKPRLILFGSKEAVMFQLVGTLERFLTMIARD